ncbi:MAG: Gldg family protein [Pseudomonadales bacterium]
MRFDMIMRTASKELTLFFGSPVGYLFIGSFLAVSLFVVFWAEAFFARNIADVRPLFEWMPVLLIFLSAAITMRMWSEERRSGTLEFVTTVPVNAWEFVLGKFLACWTLLGIALVLTLPLPISVSVIAELDWGPVWAGYVAAMLLGAAYLAVGLFVSARTDSQIVSLILAVLVSGALYMVGTPILTDLVGGKGADLLRSMGTGSRFESITRGVLDLRDLYFYVSLAALFLALNVYALESGRWAADGDRGRHGRWRLGTGLLVANLLVGNVLLGAVKPPRLDMTEGGLYSISGATNAYLGQLQEPLLIRGYFSSKTHPLLAPLVPRMRDLLAEYEVAGAGRVRVEVIDPVEHPELEDEANSKYGIRPVPFQVSDRYQASLLNSYFDVLISYGDEFEVLSFRDLIDVKVVGEDDLSVILRNPEYDITRSIKKVLYGFQGSGEVFASIVNPVKFTGYITDPARLPEPLDEFYAELTQALEKLQSDANGNFSFEFADPQAGDGALAVQLAEQYGFRPMAISLLDTETFYFYLTLASGEEVVQVPLPENLNVEAATRALNEGLKRFASGVLKTVALVAPEPPPPFAAQGAPRGNEYNQLRDFLSSDFNVVAADLATGSVPETTDLLMLIEPDGLDNKALFAVDQFLMRGGTVVMATAPFAAAMTQTSLRVNPKQSGVREWLAHHGVSFKDSLVMDPLNAPFPAPITRQEGNFRFQEMVLLDYPYFVDARGEGLAAEHPATAQLPQATITWASPIELAESITDPDAKVSSQTLVQSSERAWLSTNTDVMPQYDPNGGSPFLPTSETGRASLGVMLSGEFQSYFSGKDSPLLSAEQADAENLVTEKAEEEDKEKPQPTITSVVERSPGSARLFVFASNDFLADQITRLIGSADGTLYTNTAQLMANVVDYSLEDQSLLSIRSRGQFNRTIPPMQVAEQSMIEYVNYGLALLGLGVVWLWQRRRRSVAARTYSQWLSGGAL